MTDVFKGVTALATMVVAIVGALTALGYFNSKPTPSPAITPAAASTAEASAAVSGFRVVEATLRADPFQGSAACPVVITFSGRISVVGGSGAVSYRFIRSDGASGPVQTLTFSGPGSQNVQETWTLGASGMTLDQWEAIRILEPAELESDHAAFRITCT